MSTEYQALVQRRRRPGITAALLASLCALALALSTPPARAAETIAVEGNRHIDAETVRSYFHASPDGRYDEAARDAALKALIATNLFDKVTIERGSDGLIVHVVEAKVLDRVAFEGNKKVKDADLSAAVQSKARGTLQRATVQGDVNRIIEAYRRVGRDQVSVVPQIIDRGNDRVDLVFAITEGKKTPVRQINFVGNHAFSDRQLKAVIKTSTHSIISFLIGGDVYDPDRVDADRELIRLYYRNHGYADASVREARAEYDPVAKGFALTFTIDEGQQYRFGDISLACNVQGLDPDRLRPLLRPKRGAMFDGSALDKTTEALAIEMARQGYPFAHATPKATPDPVTQRVSVAFVIDEGQRAYIERIEIHGNSRTRDYVIRREFDFGEGDAYNKTLIDRAERRLKNLNYFKTVKITTKPGSAPDRVILDVDAEDDSTGDFNISGGYSTTDGWMGEVRLGDRNFLGSGDSVQTAVSYGQYARGGSVSVTDPWLLGNHVSGGVELFDRQTFTSPYQAYGGNTYGANFSIGTPVTETTTVLWRYSLYDQNVTIDQNSLAATPSLPVRQAAAAGPQLVSAAGDTVTYNTLDNNRLPTDGINSQLRQDIAGLGGDVRFLRTSEDVRYYHSLGNDLTGMVRAQGGYITGWGGQQAPMMNNFFGGPSMVRGFAPNGFGPRDLTPGSTMDNVGGSAYWATTAELQSGIPGIPQEYGLRGSAFVDAGSVFGYKGATSFAGQTAQIANNNVVRSSVGVGLTWASPFGALTVNYAVPLSKASYDAVQPLSFNAGPF
ncbi:MAG TPA: outer membrane protein assembly factor BamA [Bradyrhizobium sp.]|uniref:outer membrane protein assembly factor BamA n=1 Tax=Bradyrhizobium sp. TaxID=376 RepID=UPI002CA8C115|nr:outer membrane protein assembly factor BamA [Bradyrhizobium sp.]HLZ06930.1 outer membrane protein assembly factor BamA [Bradyrhizobium sp.]